MEWANNEIDLLMAELPEVSSEDEAKAREKVVDMLSACKEAYGILGQTSQVRRDYVQWVITRLLNRLPLTPITEDDFEESYCKRYPKLAQEGDKYIDYARVIVYDETGMKYRSNTITRLVHEDIPITLPYKPGREIKVNSCEWTTNGEEDFDTVELKYLCGAVYKRRFFKAPEDGDDLIEISLKEFEERVNGATQGGKDA